MKKIIAIALATLILMLSLCGCGAVSESSSQSYEESSTTVIMYDFNGNVVQQWNDVYSAYGSDEEVWFYLNNGEYIEIHGAPVVIIEEG